MKNIITKMLLLVLVFSIVAACIGNDSQSKTLEADKKIKIQQNPSRAIHKALKLSQNTKDIQPKIADREPVKVSFKELIEHLPQPPQGWTAKKPKGETISLGNYSISQVSQR